MKTVIKLGMGALCAMALMQASATTCDLKVADVKYTNSKTAFAVEPVNGVLTANYVLGESGPIIACSKLADNDNISCKLPWAIKEGQKMTIRLFTDEGIACEVESDVDTMREGKVVSLPS